MKSAKDGVRIDPNFCYQYYWFNIKELNIERINRIKETYN